MTDTTATHAASPAPRAAGRGFTLVESVTTLTILAVLLAIAAPVVSTAMEGYAQTAVRAELANNASVAMERVVSELRDIPMRSGVGTAAPAIDSLAPHSIAWTGGGALTLAGSTLNLATPGETSQLLLTDVQAFTIQAYDENNAALGSSLSGSACDSIRRLAITITTARDGTTETLRTRVFLRCMVAGAAP